MAVSLFEQELVALFSTSFLTIYKCKILSRKLNSKTHLWHINPGDGQSFEKQFFKTQLELCVDFVCPREDCNGLDWWSSLERHLETVKYQTTIFPF